ncbi:hypothetical protein CDN99_17780 [Roseateles aquatilis]|uniref:Biotin synthase n=1 Tax=Roseateles aquatilis TaxID=431061 RepID=A0A246J550_9BURK|nr:hypothetical protein CDN99_17780 [Roseateles aquatilis]
MHAEVASRMLDRLPVIRLQPRAVLQSRPSIGGGDEGLRGHYPQATQLWLEPDDDVRAMLQQRLKRGWMQSMVDRLRGGAPTELIAEPPAAAAQLLWSNMELHAEADKPALVTRWHAGLEVEGCLMFSCLGPDSFIELRPIFAREGWGAPAPDWVDMHDLGDLLVHAGFADPVMDQEHLRLTWGSPADLLRDLRALGGNLAPARLRGMRTKAWRDRLMSALEALRGPDSRLSLSVELVYGHAFKPQPRLKVAATTEVSLDQMRAMVRGAGKH